MDDKATFALIALAAALVLYGAPAIIAAIHRSAPAVVLILLMLVANVALAFAVPLVTYYPVAAVLWSASAIVAMLAVLAQKLAPPPAAPMPFDPYYQQEDRRW